VHSLFPDDESALERVAEGVAGTGHHRLGGLADRDRPPLSGHIDFPERAADASHAIRRVERGSVNVFEDSP
jgi:hypothetical protein